MEGSNRKKTSTNKVTEAIIFTVSFPLLENKNQISITTTVLGNSVKEKIINQAFKFYLQGNILEAEKYYKYFIEKGFNYYKVFSNYGTILKDLGKLNEAELSIRKAIELNPNSPDNYLNFGSILIDLDQLPEAEISTRKAKNE